MSSTALRMARRDDGRQPIGFPREAILTVEQLADWMQVSPSTVEHSDIPALVNMPGSRLRRYSAGMVLAFLEGRLERYLETGR